MIKISEEAEFEKSLIKDFKCLSEDTKNKCIKELDNEINRLKFYKNEDVDCFESIKEKLLQLMVQFKRGEIK